MKGNARWVVADLLGETTGFAAKLDNLTDRNWTVLGSNRRLLLIVVDYYINTKY